MKSIPYKQRDKNEHNKIACRYLPGRIHNHNETRKTQPQQNGAHKLHASRVRFEEMICRETAQHCKENNVRWPLRPADNICGCTQPERHKCSQSSIAPQNYFEEQVQHCEAREDLEPPKPCQAALTAQNEVSPRGRPCEC